MKKHPCEEEDDEKVRKLAKNMKIKIVFGFYIIDVKKEITPKKYEKNMYKEDPYWTIKQCRYG